MSLQLLSCSKEQHVYTQRISDLTVDKTRGGGPDTESISTNDQVDERAAAARKGAAPKLNRVCQL